VFKAIIEKKDVKIDSCDGLKSQQECWANQISNQTLMK